MSEKVRHIDFYADEFLAGTRMLTDAEVGIYWRACSLNYSHGGPVEIAELQRWCQSRGRNFTAIVERLVAAGKLVRNGSQIVSKRALNELESATKRVRNARENGSKGGRPRKQINDIEKPTGSPPRVTTNHQLPTTNQKKDARAALKAEFAEWYLAYPHKVGPGAAEQKFAVARRSTSLAELLDGVVRYKRTKPADHPWCNPATWLYQRRWEDQPADLLAKVNGHAGQTGPPPAPIDPKKLGHSLPCHCGNCLRWAALTREDAHVEPARQPPRP